MVKLRRDLSFGNRWINGSVTLFLTQSACNSLFNDAEKQNIILWPGENLRVLASITGMELEAEALVCLHQASSSEGNSLILKMSVILNALIDQNKGPLERDTIQRLNRNRFNVVIRDRVLSRVAKAHQERYGDNPFC